MKSSVCYYSLIFCLIVLVVFTYSATASCEDNALGIESKTIPDGQLTSSSSFNASTPAKNARLNFVGLPWCAVESSTPLYLQVDLGSLHAVCAVATQGNSKADQWVETYQLKTSTDGTTWTDYEEGGQVREFQENADSNTTVKQALFEGVVSRYVRVVPKTCREFCCLRVELYGALGYGATHMANSSYKLRYSILKLKVNAVSGSSSENTARLDNSWVAWKILLNYMLACCGSNITQASSGP